MYDFYNSTHGEDWNWKNTTLYGARWSFTSTANPCVDSWQGLTCLLLGGGTSFSIWQMDLLGYNLQGSLPDSIGDLPHLAILSLGDNFLTGSIPDSITTLTGLGLLEASYNRLNGSLPSAMGNMVTLENLILTGNQLNGTIPESIQNLAQLEYLDLANNHFNGTIPAFIGDLAEMRYVELNNNLFTGRIPGSFANLHKLNNLDLYNNELTGPLPALDQLTQLNYLQVEYNHLTGTIPSGIGRSLPLRGLSMQYNNISGSIPHSLGYLVHLERIQLNNNILNGSLPASMGNLSSLTSLDLSSNQLTGSIPYSMGQLTQLTALDLQINHLNGTLPSSIGNWTLLTELLLHNNKFTGTLPETIGNLSSLTTLLLSHTYLSGQLPDAIGYLTKLDTLHADTCHFWGSLPNTMGNMVSLTELVMSENIFYGTIPASLGKLPLLQTMNLHSNELDGTLPAEFGYMPSLRQLQLAVNYLTGTVPASYANLRLIIFVVGVNRLHGELPVFPVGTPLIALMLYANQFSGTIPESYGALSMLTLLVLGSNNLHGTIPASLGNLSALQDLSIFESFLTGTIPPELGQLSYLSTIDLTRNLLEGPIPASMGNFQLMTFIGLSYNSLSGALPEELGRMSRLSYMSLFNNRLSESIPSSFSGLASLISMQLQNNALSGSLEDVFNPDVQYFLEEIQLSSNALTGQIPSAAFSLPSLQSFVSISNCFDGALPEAICSAQGLRTLDLDALHSASACRTKLFETSISAYITQDAVHGTIPACIFQLPSLQTLHLSSNALTGSLPGDLVVSQSLLDLSLSYNKLTGSIPDGIQLRPWYNLDLSYNRLTGTLSDGFASQVPGSLALYLQYNKLSGILPAAVIQAENVSVLQSSIFSCDVAHTDLPANDPYSDIYQCGSDTTNTPYYAWLACFVMATVVVLVALRWRVQIDKWLGISAQLQLARKWLTYTENSPPETSPVDDATDMMSLKHAFLVCRSLCQVGLWCALYAVLILAPAYIILTKYCGTHTYEYIWSVSIILLQGDTALAVEFVLLFLLAVMFLYLCVVYLRPTAQAAPRAESRALSILSARSSTAPPDKVAAESTLPAAEDMQSNLTTPSEDAPSKYHTWTMYFLYVFINFTIVGIVNIYYVFLKLNSTPSFQLTISAFKVVWNGLISPILSRHFLRPRSEHNTLELFVALANTIAIPILAVVFVSPDCFYHAFVRESDITVTYSAYVCAVEDSPGHCAVNSAVQAIITFPPPYLYNYQCSYVFAEFYVPAFIYVCLFATFGIPLVEVSLVFLHARAVPGTCWFTFINTVTPRVLKPVTENATFPRNVLRPYFDATQFVITQLTYLALLLTFGAVFPPLAFSLGVTMISTIVLTRAKVGRFLHNALIARLSGYEIAIEDECAGIGGIYMLRRSVWMILNLCAIFYGLFMFDTIGTTTGFKGSFWVLVVVPFLPTILYSVYSLCVRCVPERFASMLRIPWAAAAVRTSDIKASAGVEGDNVRTISALHLSAAAASGEVIVEEHSIGTEL